MCDAYGSMTPSRATHSVDRLLELTYRAEQSHFWFRGFRQYMQPARSRAPPRASRRRASSTAAAAPARTSRCCGPFGDAVGFDLTRIGTEFAKSHGHRVAQASIGDIPFRAARSIW